MSVGACVCEGGGGGGVCIFTQESKYTATLSRQTIRLGSTFHATNGEVKITIKP